MLARDILLLNYLLVLDMIQYVKVKVKENEGESCRVFCLLVIFKNLVYIKCVLIMLIMLMFVCRYICILIQL